MKHSENTIKIGNDIINNCTNCKKCINDCMFLKDNADSIESFVIKFLKDDNFDPLTAYSCSLCNRCTKVCCPKNLELRNFFASIRNDIVLQNNCKSPLKKHGAIHMHQILGFSKIFSTTKKGGTKE